MKKSDKRKEQMEIVIEKYNRLKCEDAKYVLGVMDGILIKESNDAILAEQIKVCSN